MKNREDIIYDLIFSDNTDYSINVGDYVSDIYKYDGFIDDIKLILKKSKVIIVAEEISVDSKFVIWELKVKK